MRCLASSATAMLTPASAYFMATLSRPCADQKRTHENVKNILLRYDAAAGGHPMRAARFYREAGDCELKSSEEAFPANEPWVDDGIAIGENALANLAGFPRSVADIEGHVDHHGSADDVVARN